MAAISVKELNRELDCPVCMDTLKNPKVLSCSHAVCANCLKQCEKNSEVGSGKIRCPKCRNLITLPGEGVAGLKSNPLICRLLEVLEAKKNSSKIMCDACGDSDAPLTTYCRDCLHFICDSCASYHGKMKLLMKDHRTVPLDKIVNGTIKIKWSEEGLWRKAYECEEHRGELQRFYCRTCKRRICRDCIVLDHTKPDHDCTTVQKMFQEIQAEVKDLVKSCSEKDEKIRSMLKDVREREKDADGKIRGMEKSIKDSKTTAIAILNKAEGEHLKEVEVFERKLRKKMEAFRDSLQATKGDLEKVQSKAKDVISAKHIDDLNRASFFPEDILRELKEVIASELPTMTISKDLVALKCTMVQGPKFRETMLPIAKLSLPHIWRETKLLPNPHKDIVNIFCDGISVYIACKKEIYKKVLSCDVESSSCLRLHHPNTNIKQVVDMAISVKDKTLSFVAETNRSGMLLYHVYTLKLDDFPALQQSANASPSLYTPSPCPLTNSMARITIDSQSRIVIADNVASFRSGAQTSASATPESVSDSTDQSQTSTSATNGNAVHTSAFSFVGQRGQGSTAKRPVAAVGGEFKFGLKLPQQQYDFLTPGSDTAKASSFSFKGSPTMLPTKVETVPSPKASTEQDVKTESTKFGQTNFTMSSTIYRGPQSPADNFKVPIDKVQCLAATKSGQLVFLRWDKKAVIITDQYGRVQHEIKEPWRMYLSISCTESDALYVLSASWGSHTISLTKHSLKDGSLLEYVIENLDVSGKFPPDEWPIICNHGDELVMINTGEVIRVYSAEAWDILDDR